MTGNCIKHYDKEHTNNRFNIIKWKLTFKLLTLFFHDLESSEKEDMILLHCLQIYRSNMTVETRYSETKHTHKIFIYSCHLPEWSFEHFGLDPTPHWCSSEYNLRNCGSPQDGGHFLQTFVGRGSYKSESQKENHYDLRISYCIQVKLQNWSLPIYAKEMCDLAPSLRVGL